MRTHVKALAVMNLIHAILVFTFGLIALVLFGGLAAMANTRPEAGEIVMPMLGMMGGLLFLALTMLALPKFIASIGLLYYKPWARILTVVISGLGLWEIPFGTALGLYGLWVLTSREGTALFDNGGRVVLGSAVAMPPR